MPAVSRAWATDASSRGPSTRLWGREAQPLTGQLWQDPNYGWGFFDDFLTFYADTNKYNITTDGGIAPIATTTGGVIQLAPGGTANNEAVLRYALDTGSPFKIDAGAGKLWFECRVRVSSVTNNALAWAVGLIEEGGGAANTLADTTLALQDKDYVAIYTKKADADAMVTGYNTAGGTAVDLDSSLDYGALAAATWVKLGFRFDGEKTITFFVNGTPESTTVDEDATGFPDGEEMAPFFAIKTAGTAVTLDVDWVACAQQAV